MKYSIYPKFSILLLLFVIQISCSADESENDEMVVPLTATIEGRYTGTIELTLDGTDITAPASMIIRQEGTTRYAGQFFETNSFTPCCSTNPQDGTFSFIYNPADMTIENFVIGVDFNRTPCTGTYTGSGRLEQGETNIILADMNIDDCFVDNTISLLTLAKIGELQ